MESRHTHRESDTYPIGSPMTAAAILLAIYVAMYLAVGGLVHLLGAPADARVASAWPELAPNVSTQTTGPDRTASPEHADAHAD